jgi:hypothetical protein
MSIDGEPANGDYVRYIDELINRGQPAPGQVIVQPRGIAATASRPGPGEVVVTPPRGISMPQVPWKRGTVQAESKAAEPPVAGATGAQTTLAGRTTKRRGAVAVAIVALAILWQAVRMLITALNQPQIDWNDLVPVAFLFVFAAMLWQAGRGQRAAAKQPPGRLPPLTTIPKNGKARPAP